MVAHKDLGDHQIFPPKHLLQIGVGIVLLERLRIFISLCVLVTSIQDLTPREACFIHQQQHLTEKGWETLYSDAVTIRRSLFHAIIRGYLQSLNTLYVEQM
jgi:hypothetical protein